MARQLTPEEIEEAEAFGKTPEQYAEILDQQKLAKGTYKFNIASCKVDTVTADNKLKGAIQANFRLVPLDSNGNPCKRYGGVFKKITMPWANGTFVPTPEGEQIAINELRWVAKATGATVAELTRSFKMMQTPAAVLNKQIVGRFSSEPSKKDPNKAFDDVKPADAGAKLTPLKPDSGSKSSSNDSPSTSSSADAEVPF